LVDLVLSYIIVPASTVLAVVCADGPYGLTENDGPEFDEHEID